MPQVHEEPEGYEASEGQVIKRAATFAEALSRTSTGSGFELDEMYASEPALPPARWTAGSLVQSPRSSDAELVAVASMASLQPGSAEPSVGLRRRVTLTDLHAAVRRNSIELGVIAEEPRPVRAGSQVNDRDLSQEDPPEPEAEAGARSAGFQSLKDMQQKILTHAPQNLEMGGNFLATLGALIDSKPVVITGSSLTLAKAGAEFAQAYQDKNWRKMAVASGNIGVGGINLAALVTESETILQGTAGMLAITVAVADQYLNRDRSEVARARRGEDLERRGSGLSEPSAEGRGTTQGGTSTGVVLPPQRGTNTTRGRGGARR
ncbi:hypothetical protein ABT336_19380 [Micromonospora sp. NPDC000207]|uniref:hypothetical protein n=1 Tax=Micromonospora sp. NPDC000207 TaxID=3154246 RepID=UPI00332A80F4